MGGPIVAADLRSRVAVHTDRYLGSLRRHAGLWARTPYSDGASGAAAWGFLLALTLCSGLGMRLWLAFHDDGIYWPDEIYQSLEPAHRVVFGFGMLPWEFVQGARNWTLPGLIAGFFKAADLLRLPRPIGYLALTRITLCVAATSATYFTYRLARRLGASQPAATAGATLLALGAVPIYFSPRALGETVSMLPVAVGFALALPRGDRKWRLLGVALLAIAVFLRLQNGIFCAALLIVLLVSRRYRESLEAAVLLAAAGVAYGVVDLLTWGDWFHSARVYLLFNLRGGASGWGVSPFTYYAKHLARLPWLWGVALIGFAVLGSWRSPALAFAAGAFLLIHSLTPHKEFRFLLPAFPLLGALGALGLDELRRLPPLVFRSATATVIAIALLSGATLGRLTFTDLGANLSPAGSAYDASGPLNRLLVEAHNQPGLCGIDIEGATLPWSGGYTYLDRSVPMFTAGGPGPAYYNYLVADKEYLSANRLAPDASLIKRDHSWSLFRVSQSCRMTAPPNSGL